MTQEKAEPRVAERQFTASVPRKYAVYLINDVPTPILFPQHVPHKGVVLPLSELVGIESRKLVSAGFFQIAAGYVHAFGASESLGVSSRKEDSEIIARFIGLAAA